MSGHALPLTGERTLPGIDHERYWFARHVAAYRFAAAASFGATGRDRRCAARPAVHVGPRVLDAGCGEGYGTAILAETAACALGIDRAADVVAHATGAYPAAWFVTADLAALPLPSGSIDLAVSLQVIEHLWDARAALAEAARVLAPGGRLICSTPNRLTFSPGDAPANPFHVEEFSSAELTAVLDGVFEVDAVLGVRHGPRLAATEAEAGRRLPDLLLEAPAEDRPGWLARLISSVEPDDFDISTDDIEGSLDLVAVARKR